MSTGGWAQHEWSPCIFIQVLGLHSVSFFQNLGVACLIVSGIRYLFLAKIMELIVHRNSLTDWWSSLFATALILLLLVGHEGRVRRGEWLWKKERKLVDEIVHFVPLSSWGEIVDVCCGLVSLFLLGMIKSVLYCLVLLFGNNWLAYSFIHGVRIWSFLAEKTIKFIENVSYSLLQGDHLRCSQHSLDIITKVPFSLRLMYLNTTFLCFGANGRLGTTWVVTLYSAVLPNAMNRILIYVHEWCICICLRVYHVWVMCLE